MFQNDLISEHITLVNGDIVGSTTGQVIDADPYTYGNQAPSISFAVVRRPWALDVSTDIG